MLETLCIPWFREYSANNYDIYGIIENIHLIINVDFHRTVYRISVMKDKVKVKTVYNGYYMCVSWMF